MGLAWKGKRVGDELFASAQGVLILTCADVHESEIFGLVCSLSFSALYPKGSEVPGSLDPC